MPVTVEALSERAGRLRDIGDVERIAHGLTGASTSWPPSTARSGPGERVRGAAAVSRAVGGVAVAADRADRLAAVIGRPRRTAPGRAPAGLPLPYPLDDRCVWQGVQAVPSFDCLLIDTDGQARTQPWWTPPEPQRAWQEGVPAVRSALTAAVDTCTADGAR
ncbi:hypothetical protein O1M54_50070 [Streptomyces diastatochromogenes]|nr:hypothetical protein [Streptomyces diastatochromogenes]